MITPHIFKSPEDGATVMEFWDQSNRKVTVFVDSSPEEEVSYFKIYPDGRIEEGTISGLQDIVSLYTWIIAKD